MTRIRLSEAARALASALYGRSWCTLEAKRAARGSLTDRAEHDAWVRYYFELVDEVLLRLRNGTWRACRGCWRGAASSASVPIELWNRRDVALNPWHGKVSWAGDWIDELTVEVTETKQPTARRANTEPTREQNEVYDAHCAGRPLGRDASEKFAVSRGWPAGIGRKLWNARKKQPPGRPEKLAK